MKILVSGSSGLVGKSLVKRLTGEGHDVVRLVRHPSSNNKELVWEPTKPVSDLTPFNGFDAVINLAGDSIAKGRWTAEKKKRIRDSRVIGTQNLATALAKVPNPPIVFINASAVGYYGDRGGEILTEKSAEGRGYLTDVCKEWEAAADPVRKAGARVAFVRFGIILSTEGGALATMLPPFKMGVGGRLGSGEQYMSWIDLDDVVGIIDFVLNNNALSGPVNVGAPEPVTNAEFTRVLGKTISRPTIFPMPAFAARLVFGEMADALLLSSARMVPAKLQEAGYKFQYPQLEGSLRHLLGEVVKH